MPKESTATGTNQPAQAATPAPAPATATATTAAPPAAVTPTPAQAPATEPKLQAGGRLSLADMGEPQVTTDAPAAPATPAPAPATEPEAPPAVAEPAQPGEPEAPAAPATPEATVLKMKNGREFKTPDELLTAHENSSAEGLRLSAETKTLKLSQDDLVSRLQAANNAILELQMVAGDGLYPGTKSAEDIETMSEKDRTNYYLDERDWNKRREAFKQNIASVKTESENFAKKVQDEMARNEQIMLADTTKYPEYKELEPLRAEILKTSPHLANRPDSTYNAWLIAMGLTKVKELEETRTMTEKARTDAAAKAEAVGKQAATGATPPPATPAPAPKSTGFEKMVEAGRKRRSAY